MATVAYDACSEKLCIYITHIIHGGQEIARGLGKSPFWKTSFTEFPVRAVQYNTYYVLRSWHCTNRVRIFIYIIMHMYYTYIYMWVWCLPGRGLVKCPTLVAVTYQHGVAETDSFLCGVGVLVCACVFMCKCATISVCIEGGRLHG